MKIHIIGDCVINFDPQPGLTDWAGGSRLRQPNLND